MGTLRQKLSVWRCLDMIMPLVMVVCAGGRLFCLIFGIIGIPFMLSVLANIGSLMAEGLELVWSSNKARVRRLGRLLTRRGRRKRRKIPEEEKTEDAADTEKSAEELEDDAESAEEEEEEEDEIATSG